MGTFVTGNTALPTPKTDAFPSQGLTTELDAADINGLWGALADVRTHGLGWTNAVEWGADPGSSAAVNTANMQLALNSGAGIVYVTPGQFNVNELNVPTGVIFSGVGAGKSILLYGGTAACITMDGCHLSEVRMLQVVTSSTNAGVKGVWIKNTVASSQWNTVENCVFIQNSATGRAAGQVGITIEDNSASVLAQFWNAIEKNRFLSWETDIACVQSGAGADGVNQCYFANNMGAAFITHLKFGPRCGDHVVVGLFGSHSSGSAFNDTVFVAGDGVGNSGGSHIYGLIADMGAAGRGFDIKDVSARNLIMETNESSLQSTEEGAGNRGNIMVSTVQNITTAHFGAGRRVQFPGLDTEAFGQVQMAGQVLLRQQVQEDKKVLVADAAYTVLSTDRSVYFTSLTATRIVTLPAPGGVSGLRITIKDKSRAASGTIKIQVKSAAGSVEGVASPGTFDAIIGAPFVANFLCDGTDWNLV